MARKRNESRPILPTESGGAAAAPVKRTRTPRAKAASQPAAEQVSGNTTEAPAAQVLHAAYAKPTTIEPRVEPAGASQTQVSFEPISEHDEIARLAYSYWEARGGHGGSAEEDWLRAVEEFRVRRQSETS